MPFLKPRFVQTLFPILLMAAMLLQAFVAEGYTDPQHTTFLPVVFKLVHPVAGLTHYGTIAGKVSIGPLCPIEPCPSPQPDVYSLRKLVLQPQMGNPQYVNLQPDGSFEAAVPAGSYSVTLTNCTFLGCGRALPKTAVIEANKVTTLEIMIDTGIR